MLGFNLIFYFNFSFIFIKNMIIIKNVIILKYKKDNIIFFFDFIIKFF